METKDILLELRKKHNFTQDELAEKVFLTRQAVSRWESGETTPNAETLKLLSKLYDVSINTLLGSPRQLICQCCGMPLDENSVSPIDGEYCKWCYTDDGFVYKDIDSLLDFLVEHMHGDRAEMKKYLRELKHWAPAK